MTIVDRYASVAFDIDGVLVRGEVALPGVSITLAALADAGTPVSFVTNNARRTPQQIAEWLAQTGLEVDPSAVVTSAMAAASLLEPACRCLVIGMDGLRAALETRGCVHTDDPEEAEAVVVGFDESVDYEDLRRATIAISLGARFVGTNADTSLPVEGGRVWPGNGAILAALAAATGREPEIAGKPNRPLFDAAAQRLRQGGSPASGGNGGATRLEPLLFVGDRVETDIVGAAAAGWDTALALTGVSNRRDAATSDPAPTYIVESLTELLE